MSVERAEGTTSLVDVLDRVLDKGIVIDTWIRHTLVGIDLVTARARVVVTSIATYLKSPDRLGPVSASPKFGNVASSRSALRRDDDDDDDGGPDGSGGAPALLEFPLTGRRRSSSPRERTRRR